jgi:hypothetical protein
LRFREGKLDLDFVTCLLANRLIFDRESCDSFLRSPFAALAPAQETLRRLLGEGWLFLCDYGKSLGVANRNRIVEGTKERIQNAHQYKAAVRSSILEWDRIAPRIAAALGRSRDLLAVQPIGILHANRAAGDRVTLRKVEEARRIMFKDGKCSRSEQELFHETARPYFDRAHTIFEQASEGAIGQPCCDWRDMDYIYDRIWSTTAGAHPQQNLARARKVRELFDVSPRSIEPRSVDEFLDLVDDPSIEGFRKFIDTSIANGARYGYETWGLLLNHLRRRQRHLRKNSHRMASLSTIAGTGAHLAFHGDRWLAIPLGLGLHFGATTAAKALENHLTKDLRWVELFADLHSPPSGEDTQ